MRKLETASTILVDPLSALKKSAACEPIRLPARVVTIRQSQFRLRVFKNSPYKQHELRTFIAGSAISNAITQSLLVVDS